MHSTRLAVAVLVAVIGAAGIATAVAPGPTMATGECGTYKSETQPPPTIRVLRTATRAVETVDFGAYVKNVLSREWISSWTTESIRSGALAVKHYAWYQVVHWRGYLNDVGECFDVFDSVRDQLYDPSRPTYPAMAEAVDATWTTLALRAGRLFPTYYDAGSTGEACGADANGWQMHQWGTQACGLDGLSAAEIMAIYYSDVTVTDAPDPATPAPTPPPTPAPTPAPSPGPDATPMPTPASTPAPAPAEQPGGGQAGLIAPPPPPPADPQPAVVHVEQPVVLAVAKPPTVQVPAALDDARTLFEGDGTNSPDARAGGPLGARVRLMLLCLALDRALNQVIDWRPWRGVGSDGGALKGSGLR